MSKVYHVPPQGPDRGQQQQNTPKTPSLGVTIAKVAVGAMFIVIGLEDLFTDFSGTMIGIIIGAALIAWGLIPYREAKRRQQAEETEKILSTPVPDFDEEDEAEMLAKKYSGR